MAQYIDIDINPLDNLYIFDKDAIKQSLLLWLTYSRKDLLMNPTEAGILDLQQFKTLSDEKVELFRITLLHAINKYFVPAITVLSLVCEPDYKDYKIYVDIVYSIPEYNVEDTLTFYVNTTYSQPKFNYIYVDYVGENLYNFMLNEKDKQKEHKLLYDYILNKWKWGKYVFTNLDISDEYFDKILILANNM